MADKAVSDGGQIITIIVFNSIRPYAYEVNNVLAPPDGFPYRFRFRRKWIDPMIDPSELEGSAGLAVLRDFETARFFPLRRIRITDVLQVGEVSYIEYIVGDTIELDSNEAARQQQLARINDRMREAIADCPNRPGDDLAKLIFRYTDVAFDVKDMHYTGGKQNRDLRRWGNLVQVIGQLECYTDFDFLKLIRIVDNKGQAAPVVLHRSPDTARFHLRSDTVYRAHVFQTTYTHREADSAVLSSRQVAFQGEPGAVRMIRSSHSVAGKYDLMQFSFKTEPTARAKETSLSMEVRRQVRQEARRNDRDDVAPPNIDVAIRISAGWAQKAVWISSSVFFVLGFALLFGADSIAGAVGLQVTLVERIGILIAIVSSFGAGPIARSVAERFELAHPV